MFVCVDNKKIKILQDNINTYIFFFLVTFGIANFLFCFLYCVQKNK
jgi:hypothetical protein